MTEQSENDEAAANSADQSREPGGQGGEALVQLNARQEELFNGMRGLAQQNAVIGQQMGQVYSAVRQLYDAVSVQCNQLLASDTALLGELERLQTGGPQRAMAGLFHKLMRDLVDQVAHMDEVLEAANGQAADQAAQPWIEAIRIIRDGLEDCLGQWGCHAMPVEAGKELFDPGLHQAAEPLPDEALPACPPGVIAKVRRRGWKLNDYVLVYPQVLVG